MLAGKGGGEGARGGARRQGISVVLNRCQFAVVCRIVVAIVVGVEAGQELVLDFLGIDVVGSSQVQIPFELGW